MAKGSSATGPSSGSRAILSSVPRSQYVVHEVAETKSGPDRVTISIDGSEWDGTAAQAERVLTGLHYALARARPGINIGSMLVNGSLWGGKFIEADEEEAVRLMRTLVAQLGEHLEGLGREPQAEN